MTKKVRVALYCRVSSEDQGGTIENQIRFLEKYCALHNLEVAGLYSDDGVSGVLPLEERPEGRCLLEDAAKRRFDTVLVYRLDRLAHRTLVLLRAHEQLQEMGVALRSATEAFDSGTPSGQFFMTTLAGIASLERSTVLERTMLGKRRRLAEGRWATGGQPPLGHSRNGEGYLQVEPEEAEIVRTIFRLYAEEGMTTPSINTHKGHRNIWLAARVSTILLDVWWRR